VAATAVAFAGDWTPCPQGRCARRRSAKRERPDLAGLRDSSGLEGKALQKLPMPLATEKSGRMKALGIKRPKRRFLREHQPMRPSDLWILLVALFLGACTPATGMPPSAPAKAPGDAATATPACETHTAEVTLSVTPENPKVGEILTITAALRNDGCAMLGIPQYRLSVNPADSQSLLAPPKQATVTHSAGLGRGETDTAAFVTRAVAAGQATATVFVSFEVHLGYPGPAYWGSAAGELPITVVP